MENCISHPARIFLLSDQIELAFSKKLADARKEWLMAYKPGTHVDNAGSPLRYADFIDKELVLFSLGMDSIALASV